MAAEKTWSVPYYCSINPLLWLENGLVKHTTTVPESAYIATPDQLPEVVAKALPGMKLINRHAFDRLEELHNGIKAALSVSEDFASDIIKIVDQETAGQQTQRQTNKADEYVEIPAWNSSK